MDQSKSASQQPEDKKEGESTRQEHPAQPFEDKSETKKKLISSSRNRNNLNQNSQKVPEPNKNNVNNREKVVNSEPVNVKENIQRTSKQIAENGNLKKVGPSNDSKPQVPKAQDVANTVNGVPSGSKAADQGKSQQSANAQANKNQVQKSKGKTVQNQIEAGGLADKNAKDKAKKVEAPVQNGDQELVKNQDENCAPNITKPQNGQVALPAQQSKKSKKKSNSKAKMVPAEATNEKSKLKTLEEKKEVVNLDNVPLDVKLVEADQIMEEEAYINEFDQVDQDGQLVGKKRSHDEIIEVPQHQNQDMPQISMSNNPIQAIMMENLNQSHNTQRRRDIKQNYKAKLPLDKLIQEHQKKKQQVHELVDKRILLIDKITQLWDNIGIRQGVDLDKDMHLPFLQQNENTELEAENKVIIPNINQDNQKSIFVDQTEFYKKYSATANAQNASGKSHWDFLLKEMVWMADDFDKENKKKVQDSKKMVRNCKRHIHEKYVAKERQLREQKVDMKRKSKFMSNIVQLYWKSCEKIVKHNYNVEYERKRQQMRTKKLENFVSKHLKLSVKVAESLNTRQFVQQSKYTEKDEKDDIENQDDEQNQSKIEAANQDKQKEEIEGDDDESNKSLAEQTVEIAQKFQPMGHTLDSAQVTTQVPFLLKGSLREYQIIGLDWMVTLHNRKLNGILADEMGLGKTIQTIAMLASLACDKGAWGPHLIVVPTTIIMNWEMEFKRWCPGFKILTYFGNQKERRIKRHGWSKENSFHICITSYKLVIQDHFAFRRKKWYYMILDEAQNIKNFKSQRWQTLLRFNTKRRLLLTGTPLQNDVMELWSLMHFLMPNIFSNQQDFKEWFSNPFSQSINQNKSLNLRVVQKLQSILRPFLLRRMKKDVEKQLPCKIEHIVQCNLSRRQRLLYDEYINTDKTRNVLADTDFFSIMSVLMQLRKVCNHPDLFEARTIESPFILTGHDRITYNFPQFVLKELHSASYQQETDLANLNFRLIDHEQRNSRICQRQIELLPARSLDSIIFEKRHLIESNDQIYNKSTFSQNERICRPFHEGLAVSKRHEINSHQLHKKNASTLNQTIPNIMPFDSDINYRMQYHKIPSYVNAACLPFTQQEFSMPKYDSMRYSSYDGGPFEPIQVFKSAIQGEEHKQMLVNLARKLALWHAADRKNRLQILYGQPVFGEDLRQAINVNLVCQDIFETKGFKYVNWVKYRLYKQNQQQKHPKSKDKVKITYEELMNQINVIQQSVLNPLCQQGGVYDPEPQRVIISNWPYQTEQEIETLNSQNLLIKEITQKTRIAMRLKKEQREEQERLEKLRQPKRVNRRKEIEIEQQELQFNIYIDMKSLNTQTSTQTKEKQDDVNMTANEIDQINLQEPEVQNDIAKVNPELDEVKEPNAQIDQDAKVPENDTEMVNDGQNQNLSQDLMQKEHINEAGEWENPNVTFREETITKIIKKTKIVEEIITYEQYLKELESDRKKKSTVDNFSVLKSPLTENLFEDEKLLLQAKVEQINQKQQKEQDEDFRNIEHINEQAKQILSMSYKNTDTLKSFIISPMQRAGQMEEIVKNFKVIVPKVVANTVEFVPSKVYTKHQKERAYERFLHQKLMQHKNVNQSLKYSNILFFPHRNLVQYDCGKLQKMAYLLKTLYNKGSKVIIFTQMTKMLDIFEQFLNLHGYIYVRLDGSVKTENRQKLVDRFNYNRKIFCFICTTRCGGVGINLTGADSVIFYDTDWNPAMDKQAQDRCHRIGQTKTVHIYRLISVNTIEENIFKKSLQKRELGGLIIEGNFNQEFFQKVSIKDILTQSDPIMQPKRIDIFKDENIIFHGDDLEDDFIIHPNVQNELDKQNEDHEEDVNDINFEANSQDMELQAQEFEKKQQIESYRKKFEEILFRIEDQEDVAAMQDAKQEMNDDAIDLHEFDNLENELDENTGANQNELTEEQLIALQKQKELALIEAQHQKEIQMKQKIHDGVNMTQGEIRKHEPIEWNNNQNLNKITKACLNYFQTNFTFEEYLDERSKKDAKFVDLVEEEKNLNKRKGGEGDNDDQDSQKQSGSEFSMSQASEIYVDVNDESTMVGSLLNEEGKKQKVIFWDRIKAQENYKMTIDGVEQQLYNPSYMDLDPASAKLFMQQPENAESLGDQQLQIDQELQPPAAEGEEIRLNNSNHNSPKNSEAAEAVISSQQIMEHMLDQDTIQQEENQQAEQNQVNNEDDEMMVDEADNMSQEVQQVQQVQQKTSIVKEHYEPIKITLDISDKQQIRIIDDDEDMQNNQ